MAYASCFYLAGFELAVQPEYRPCALTEVNDPGATFQTGLVLGVQNRNAPLLPHMQPSPRRDLQDVPPLSPAIFQRPGSSFYGALIEPRTYGAVIVLLSNVTAPLLASALPSRFTPEVIVMDVSAMMFPLNTEFVPRVAELPTCQKMFLA